LRASRDPGCEFPEPGRPAVVHVVEGDGSQDRWIEVALGETTVVVNGVITLYPDDSRSDQISDQAFGVVSANGALRGRSTAHNCIYAQPLTDACSTENGYGPADPSEPVSEP
jgi:hypothetical protein